MIRRQTTEWTVRTLADLRGRINTDAEYQRGQVWSEPQQQLLIDSLMRGYDIPKIYLRKLPDGSSNLFDVVDGVQRLTSIWQFFDDHIRLPKSAKYPGVGAVGGKCWSELPQDAQDKLQFSPVTVTQIEEAEEDDIRELFQRLQKGEPLNAAERRNAMLGPVRDFVASTLAAHLLWPETGLTNRRFGLHEMSAIVLALARAQGPTGLKGADLEDLYEDTGFVPGGEVGKRAIAWMDRLHLVAATGRGEIRTRWGVVDLMLAIDAIGWTGTDPEPLRLMEFFRLFEEERRAGAAQLSDLRSTVIELAGEDVGQDDFEIPAIKADMLAYLNAFTREGATAANVGARASVMESRLQQYLQAGDVHQRLG